MSKYFHRFPKHPSFDSHNLILPKRYPFRSNKAFTVQIASQRCRTHVISFDCSSLLYSQWLCLSITSMYVFSPVCGCLKMRLENHLLHSSVILPCCLPISLNPLISLNDTSALPTSASTSPIGLACSCNETPLRSG